MIVPIRGNVTYKITLDPTVWIFDDRKILLEEAFDDSSIKEERRTEADKTEERLGKELYQQKVKPPVNQSIKRFSKEELLSNSYVIPIIDFFNNAEPKSDASKAMLVTNHTEEEISLEQLKNSYLLFAIDGKPVREDGPVQLFFKDGSNKNNPIKGISEIIIQ